MTEDTTETNGRVTQKQLYDAIERIRLETKADLKDFRDETKEDLRGMKEELLKAIELALSEFHGWTSMHDRAHSDLEREGTHSLQDHLTQEEVATARTEGTRAAVVGAFKFLNENWKVLALLIALVFGLMDKFDISALVK